MTGTARPQPAGDDAAIGSLKPPRIAALFLIKFDKKEGYKITWRRSIPQLQLDGVVEYKSLPSGLHNLDDDIVYFIHEQYAGVSAFVKGEASEEDRNANFVAVGVLTSLGHGRMGRGWLHTDALQEMADKIATKAASIDELKAYWDKFGTKAVPESDDEIMEDVSSSTRPHSENSSEGSLRSQEYPASTRQDHYLPSSHPATTIHEVFEIFGPLIFPLHRAAILRKRILFLCSPPLKRVCNLVYNLSILSNISSSVFSSLFLDTDDDLSHIRPIFTIGVHDIPALEEQTRASPEFAAPEDGRRRSYGGWIACSTDGILEIKKGLYDYMVHIPSAQHSIMVKSKWPSLVTSHGKVIKATQRDLKRYQVLQGELQRLQSTLQYSNSNLDIEDDVDDPNASLLKQRGDESYRLTHAQLQRVDDIVEPLTWSALAYNSFLWWASAGERDANVTEEDDEDYELVKDLFSSDVTLQNSTLTAGERIAAEEGLQPNLALIEYFNRLGATVVTSMAGILELATEDGEDEGREADINDRKVVRLGRLDLEELGLDIWSENDREFVSELARLYFGRRVRAHGMSVECCGVRLC